MLGGPDPYGRNDPYGINDPQTYYPYGADYDDSPTWLDLIGQSIAAAQDVARIAVGGYPPQDVYAPIYAPHYPAQYPTPQPGAPGVGPKPGGVGFQVSTPVLILGVGGLLLFLLGQKRGR